MSESLSRLVKSSIDTWIAKLRKESPLVHAAERGEVGPRALALYLESLRFMFASSHASIRAAMTRAEELRMPELAAYFREKAEEEHGHDQWAASDLDQLPSQAVKGVEPAAACRKLVALQRELITLHPLCFLAYSVWAEYLTASLGDEWLNLLSNCGYERSAVTAVSKHLEADVEHAFEGFEALDRFWQGEPNAADIVAGVQRAAHGFEAFCAEICEVERPVSVADVRQSLPT